MGQAAGVAYWAIESGTFLVAEPVALLSEEKNGGLDEVAESTTDSLEVKKYVMARIARREVVGSERCPVYFAEFHQRKTYDGREDWKFEVGMVESPQEAKVQTPPVRDTSVAVGAEMPVGWMIETRSAGQQVERRTAAEALGNIEAKGLCAEPPA